MSGDAEPLTIGPLIDRVIGYLERAEALRVEAERKARETLLRGQGRLLDEDPISVMGDASEAFKLKQQFDQWAAPMVQAAYALGIEAAPLDDFIRTGHPRLVAAAIRVLRLVQ